MLLNTKTPVIILEAVTVIASVIAVIFILNRPAQNTVCINNNCFNVDIEKSEAEQIKGLMFVKELEENSGMLFQMPEEKTISMWMKNTLIPLDIIWIDKKETVVHIEKTAMPCEETCEAMIPETKALYVLELNGGTAGEKDIKIGDKVKINISK